jgi:hypothetical protein
MAGYTSFKQLNRQLEHLLQQTLKYLIGVGLLVSLIVAFISMIGNSVSAQD